MELRPDRKIKNHGENWIRQEKRLAIYMRDGIACVYCDSSVEEGVKLTLDHLKPYSKGGSNHESNLVTCCMKCNSSRGTRPVKTFCQSVAGYINGNATTLEIVRHVRNCSKRNLKPHLKEAKELIARRGSCAKVLNSEMEK